jgi:hypothetical protein
MIPLAAHVGGNTGGHRPTRPRSASPQFTDIGGVHRYFVCHKRL